MPDLESTLLGVELRAGVTGGAIVLLVAIALAGLRSWTRRRAPKHQEKPLAPVESVAFVQKNYPESLPRLRTRLERAPPRESTVAADP